MFVTNWNSTTKIQKISEITNFFRHYFLSRTEVDMEFSHLMWEIRCFQLTILVTVWIIVVLIWNLMVSLLVTMRLFLIICKLHLFFNLLNSIYYGN